jgi:trans-aconitate 2-methyltransferase
LLAGGGAQVGQVEAWLIHGEPSRAEAATSASKIRGRVVFIDVRMQGQTCSIVTRFRRSTGRMAYAAHIRHARSHTMAWSATQYSLFEAERTRAVRDLLAAVPPRPVRHATDLGCGPGNSTEVLLQRHPDAQVTALDSDPDMVDKARQRPRQHPAGALRDRRHRPLDGPRAPGPDPRQRFAAVGARPRQPVPHLVRQLEGGSLAVQTRTTSTNPRTGSCGTLPARGRGPQIRRLQPAAAAQRGVLLRPAQPAVRAGGCVAHHLSPPLPGTPRRWWSGSRGRHYALIWRGWTKGAGGFPAAVPAGNAARLPAGH